MALKPRELAETSSPVAVEWYCNLLYLDRRKCLLFTHPPTLFSVLVACVRKADLERFGETFRRHLADALAAEGLDPTTCLPALATEPDSFSKAIDRSTLGSMRDHQIGLKWYIELDGGWDKADAVALTKRLNETPMGMRGRKHLAYPREVVRLWLKSAGVPGVPDSP
jgi:hypothetical protein